MHDKPGSNHRCTTASGVAWATRVVAGTVCLLVHGCDTVNGGAVELSWKLRPASSSLANKFVECESGQPETGAVTGIRLHWQPGPQEAGAPQDAGSERWEDWPCDNSHGVTGFVIPEGTAELWVTPVCGFGPASPDTYIAPASVLRGVMRGDTVSLGAIELVVSVSYCRDPTAPDTANIGLQPCICCQAGETCTGP